MSMAKGEQVAAERMPLAGTTTSARCARGARVGSIGRVLKMVLNHVWSSQEFLRDAYTPVFLPDTAFPGESRDSCTNGVQIRVLKCARIARGITFRSAHESSTFGASTSLSLCRPEACVNAQRNTRSSCAEGLNTRRED